MNKSETRAEFIDPKLKHVLGELKNTLLQFFIEFQKHLYASRVA